MSEKSSRCFSGPRLLAARNAAKLSRIDLCIAIDFIVGPHTIARYELEKPPESPYIPTLNVAIRIADALAIDLNELIDAKS